MKLKSSHSAPTQTSTIRKSQTACFGIATVPIDHVPPDSGDTRIFSSGCQIQLASPLRITSSAIVAITTVSSPARCERPDHALVDADAAEERDAEREDERRPVRPAVVRDQRPRDVGREHPHLALREVDDVRRAVDEHEREREARVDRPVSEPAMTCWMNSAISSPGSDFRTPSCSRSSALAPPSTTLPTSSRYARCESCERGVRVLLDDQHREALLLVEPAHDLEELLDDDRREPERRLVEEQEPRPREARAGEREHLLLAARQRSGLLVAPLREPRQLARDLVEVLRDGLAVAAEVRAHLQVLPDRQLAEDAAALGNVRDASPRGRLRAARQLLSVEDDRAVARDHARDRAERRRLAGAVRAEQRDDLALVERQRDAVQRAHGPVARVNFTQLEEGHPRSWSPRRRDTPRSPRGSTGLSFGVPAAIVRPKSSTVTRSDTDMTRFMWCSTSRIVRS